MRKTYVLLAAILWCCGTVTFAQNNPPQFDSIFTAGTVNEGEILSWSISITDSDPDDIITVATDPPVSDPLFQGAVFVLEIEPRVWNFQFVPDYDFIESGQVDIPLTIYATDGIDTALMPVTITVVHFNPPPELTPPPESNRTADGIPVLIPITAADPDSAIPVLSAEPVAPALPNATFIDNGDGSGQFEFLPDETQAGQDYTITFIASDGEKADTVFSTITVVAYQQPTLEPVESQTVDEGDLLEFLIFGSNPIDIDVPFELNALDHPVLKFGVTDSSDTSALITLFEDSNYVKITTGYSLTYFAYNGRDTVFDTAIITVNEVDNIPPVFETVDSYTISEGIDQIVDTIVARDPEGNPVGISFLSADTVGVANLSLEEIGPDSALFQFSPDFTQGGDYRFRVIANDTLELENNAAQDTAELLIAVNEVDPPPTITLDTIGTLTGLSEGGFVRFNIEAKDFNTTDSTEEPLAISVFPPPDSSVFKGNAVYLDRGDGTGFFEFYPGYSQVSAGNDTVYNIKFTAADSLETVDVPVSITVFNVQQSQNDPFDADTLSLVGSLWDTVIITDTIPIDTLTDSLVVDTTFGFTLTSRIWNDSNLTAAMTGFRWHEPWLKLDTVLFGPRLVSGPDSAHFTRVYSNPDSLAFQATFLYLEGKSIAPDPSASWVHLTASFYVDPDSIDINQIDVDTITVHVDTASLGSNAKFVFDKQPKLASEKAAIEQYLRLLKTSDLTYPPLINLGEVRSAGTAVRMTVFDVSNAVTLGNGSSLYLYDEDDSVKQYELRISVENRRRLSSLTLGLEISSDDSAMWFYEDTASVVVASSRMAPEADVWSGSGGLLLSGSSVDGALADTLSLIGAAGMIPDDGLPPGLMEYMIRIPFTVSGVVREEARTLCFDTATIDGAAPVRFVTADGDTVIPPFSGRWCFPVRVSRVLKPEADSVVMNIYDVSGDSILGPGDILYMKDQADVTKEYEVRLGLENLRRLIGVSLGMRIYSEDGAEWSYSDTVKPRVIPESRMSPDSTIWNQTAGLIFADSSIENADGAQEDTLELVGASSQFTQFGLKPGFLEPMIAIPFAIAGVAEGDLKTLCFDTTLTDSGNAWRYIRIKTDTLSLDTLGNDTIVTVIDTISPGFSGAICLAVEYKQATGADGESPSVPVLYSLEQNYPNPFNAATSIRFSIGKRERVKIAIYNILGQRVVILADDIYPPGSHEVIWDGLDADGRVTASGIYLYRIESEGFSKTRKMILLK